MTYTITNDQAADLLTAASIRDTMNRRGGVALTDHLREQYREQLAEVEGRIPADLARAAWAAVATRGAETLAATEMFAWLREQDVTD